MSDVYFVNAEREVLSEMGAAVIADYMKFISENSIDINDTKNILIIIFKELVILKNNMFSNEFNNLDSLKMLEGKFKFAKKCLEDLREV